MVFSRARMAYVHFSYSRTCRGGVIESYHVDEVGRAAYADIQGQSGDAHLNVKITVVAEAR